MKRLFNLLNMIIKKRKELKRWQRIVMTLAAMITFVTTYALILPAITVERDNTEEVGGMYLEQEETQDDLLLENALEFTGFNIAADQENAVTFTYADESMTATAIFSTDEEIPEGARLVVSPVDTESEEYADLSGRAVVLLDREFVYDVTTCSFYNYALICDGVDVTPQTGLVDVQINFMNNTVEHVNDVVYAGRFGRAADATEGFAAMSASAGYTAETADAHVDTAVAADNDLTDSVDISDVDDELVYSNPDESSAIEFNDSIITVLSLKGNDLALTDSVVGILAGNVDEEAKAAAAETDAEIPDYDNSREGDVPADSADVDGDAAPEVKTLKATGDDYTVVLTYDESSKIPEEAYLTASEISQDSKEYKTYLKETKKAMGLTEEETLPRFAARFFDIKIMVGDVEFTPKTGVSVEITYAEPLAEETDAEVSAVHFADKKAEAEVIEANTTEIQDDGAATVEFTAESFSVYGVIYTVDFHWEVDGKRYELSMPGGSFVSFTKLAEILHVAGNDNQSDSEINKDSEASEDETLQADNIDIVDILTLDDVKVSDETREFIENVEKVEFSNPELMWIGKISDDTTVGELRLTNELETEYSAKLTAEQIAKINETRVQAGDWALISLHAFETEETVSVTMKNGDVWTVKVTDAQSDATLKDDGSGNVLTIPNPNGTTIDLFDYWISDKNTSGQQAWPDFGNYRYINYTDGQWTNYQSGGNGLWLFGSGDNKGINSKSGDNHGHALKFNPANDGSVVNGIRGDYGGWFDVAYNEQAGLNAWTGSATPRTGIVQSKLSGNYPILTNDKGLGTDGESLAYLFDPSINHAGKDSYTNVNQLLYVDPDGYYTYDSEDFKADFNKTNKVFTVSSQGTNSGEARGFWPFGQENFWLGMHIKTDFSMPENGRVLNPKGEYKDMTFEFQGDDDTWLYLDGVLVGDGGGVHNQTLIRINFREGTVYVTGKEDHAGFVSDYEKTYYLDELYTDAKVYNNYEWEDSPSGNGHKIFKVGSQHKFDMFYMERGGGYSNLRIHYNLISTTDISAHKSYHNTDNSRLRRNDYKFELIGYDNTSYSGLAAQAIMPNAVTYDSNAETGTFENPESYRVDASDGQPGYTYLRLGATEDGNVNFGNLREFSNADEGKEYRYVIREWVPPTAKNEDNIEWQNATEEQKAEGGFVLDGITYDSRVYYFIGKVEETEEGSGKYVFNKYRYLDPEYQIPDTDTRFFSFVNGKELPITLKINKEDDEEKPLSGATFSLTRAMKEGDKWVRRHWTVNTGGEDQEEYSTLRTETTSQGSLTFNNRREGHYLLEETAAPAGYEKGNPSRWLLTLTKRDSGTEILLVPTIQALDAEGNVSGLVEDLDVENHIAQFNVLNTPIQPIQISVQKEWQDVDMGELDDLTGYSAEFTLKRTYTRIVTTAHTTDPEPSATLRIGYYYNNNYMYSNPQGPWQNQFGYLTYTFKAGSTATVRYNYKDNHNDANFNWRRYRVRLGNSTIQQQDGLPDNGTINVTMPGEGQTITVYMYDNWTQWNNETAFDSLFATGIEPKPGQTTYTTEVTDTDKTDDSFSRKITIDGNGSKQFIYSQSGQENNYDFPVVVTNPSTGEMFIYKYYVEETNTTIPEGGGSYETIYIVNGKEVSEEAYGASHDHLGNGGTQKVINRKLMDIPVEKLWPDYDEKDEYTWTAKFQLDYRNMPLDGGSGQEPSGNEEGHEGWTLYEPATYVEISKGDTEQKFFEDLPMYYTDSNGVTWRREYSVREVEYYVWKLDENGEKIQPAIISKNAQGEMEGYEYTLWYRQEAGEDYNNDGVYDESDYVMSFVNMLAHRVVKEKINLNIDKNWPEGTSYATSDTAKAKFRLRRYVVEEYRNYETVASNIPWVEISLDTGTGSLQTLRVPQGQNMYIRGYVKGGTKEQNLTFSSDAGDTLPVYSYDNSASSNQREFVIPFTADTTKTITLVSSADDVSGGIHGIHLSDTSDVLAPEVDSRFSEEFELNKSNEWHKPFAELPVVEVVEMNDELTATTFMYSYFFEEIECVPESYYAVFTDSEGNVLLGDENNRIIYTADISANNLPIGFDILKVDIQNIRKKLPNAEFKLRKLDEDADLHYPIPLSDGKFAGSLVDTSETDQESGMISYEGLTPGYYEITETKAPRGYVMLEDSSIYVKVEKTGDVKLLKKQMQDETVTWVEAEPEELVGKATLASSISPAGKAIAITVRNEPGAALPHTGGPGTNLIYLLGLMLAGIAGAGLVMRKRRYIR